MGLGVTLLGLAATGWGVERIAAVKPGQTVDLGPYQATIVKLEERQGPNYSELGVRAIISQDGSTVTTIEPAKRTFRVRQTTITEAGIVTLGFGQVYISLGEQHPDGSIDARMFWKPLVTLIWIGAIVMAIGGIVSLSDRRLRIGFARRAIRGRLWRSCSAAARRMTALRRFLILLVVFAGLAPGLASAVQPDEILADSKLEARARGISVGLRCLVCQNQSIDDSSAELARDLRLLVRERV